MNNFSKNKTVMMWTEMLFPDSPSPIQTSVLLLASRVFIGLLFLNHGLEKCFSYPTLAEIFPDPLGIGSHLSLILVIFAEAVCSLFFILGFLYRLALLPMIFTMGMAFFVTHDGALPGGELPLLYMFVFLIMYISGPGFLSIDTLLKRKLKAE